VEYTVIVEHLEQEISLWLLLEYRHVSRIHGKERVWFTNVPRRYHKILSLYGRVFEKSVIALLFERYIEPAQTIVLDPQAQQKLTFNDLITARYIVIGGILGDHPPRGRTKTFITSRAPSGVKAFNIGEGQYSIDGAAYYVKYLIEHRGEEGFEYVDGVKIETEHGYVYLPYRYPLVNGRPLLADGLEYYLKYRKLREDIWREIREAQHRETQDLKTSLNSQAPQ